MDSERTALLRQVLGNTGWVDRTRNFARALRRSTQAERGLLLVGTPTHEPWHLTAHLEDEARIADLPGLAPTLVRWSAPTNAPPHLSITLARLEAARRGETLFVVAPDSATEPLLERVADARRIGATILSLDDGDPDLVGLAHESLSVPRHTLLLSDGSNAGVPGAATDRTLLVARADLSSPDVSFDVVEHLVSTAAGELDRSATGSAGSSTGRPGFRDRLARILDSISGQRDRDEDA